MCSRYDSVGRYTQCLQHLPYAVTRRGSAYYRTTTLAYGSEIFSSTVKQERDGFECLPPRMSLPRARHSYLKCAYADIYGES